MSKKQVCLYQWDYMINCNENENDNGKRDNTNKTYIDQDLDIETNIYSIACLGKTISLCNKQHLSNIWGSIYSKLSNNEAELKKALLIKKVCKSFCLCIFRFDFHIFHNFRNKPNHKSFLSPPMTAWNLSFCLIPLHFSLAFKILRQFITFFINKAVPCYNHKRNILSLYLFQFIL